MDGSTETEESLNSGVEGEWRLQGEVEGINMEFAMRQWENGGRSEEGGEGEWDLRKGRVWGNGVSCSDSLDTWGTEELGEVGDTGRQWCCDQLTEISVFISLFAVFNLCFLATGKL